MHNYYTRLKCHGDFDLFGEKVLFFLNTLPSFQNNFREIEREKNQLNSRKGTCSVLEDFEDESARTR